MPRDLKSCLWAMLYMLALYVLPLLALAVGWISRDFQTGALAGLVTFVTLVSLTAGAFILIRDPSAVTASIPLIFGMSYAVLPDAIPGTIDDGVAFTLGALLSYLLWRKRRADLPDWLLLPLFAAGAYTLVGGFILPFLGPLDEALAYLVIGGMTWARLQQAPLAAPLPAAQGVSDRIVPAEQIVPAAHENPVVIEQSAVKIFPARVDQPIPADYPPLIDLPVDDETYEPAQPGDKRDSEEPLL